jgi:hypothetical protein
LGKRFRLDETIPGALRPHDMFAVAQELECLANQLA